MEGHCFCRSSKDFKASAVQSATIQPQSSVLKGKPPCKDRVQQCSSLQRAVTVRVRPIHHRIGVPKLDIVEQQQLQHRDYLGLHAHPEPTQLSAIKSDVGLNQQHRCPDTHCEKEAAKSLARFTAYT